MGNRSAGCMWWPASGGGLAVAWIQSREACGSSDWGHGERVAVGEAWRNVGGSGEMVEGQEELANPDKAPDFTFLRMVPELACPLMPISMENQNSPLKV